MEGRHRKFWGLFVACTVAASFALVATPAPAHTPGQNDAFWNPGDFAGDETTAAGTCHEELGPSVTGDVDGPAACTVGTGDTNEDSIVSDTDAGLASEGYPLRALTDQVTNFYEWYDCDLATGLAGLFAPAAPCQLVAIDTSAYVTDTPPGVAPLNSWSGKWNITAGSEGSTTGAGRELYGVACAADAGSPGTGPPPNASHCTGETFFGGFPAFVHVDDSSSDPGGLHNGVVTSNGFVSHIIEADGTTFSGEQVHGAGLQNGQAVDVIVFTAPQGQHDAIQACWSALGTAPLGSANSALVDGAGGGCATHNNTDTSPTAGGGASCHASAPTIANTDCWRLTQSVPNLNSTFRLEIIEYDDGGTDAFNTTGVGDCDGSTNPAVGSNPIDGDDCHLNAIYVTTTPSGRPPTVGPVTPPPVPPPTRCPGRRIVGNARPNKLKGTCGPDRMFGKANNDILRGKAGNDRLVGGPGFDRCFGGPGRDKFAGCELKKQ